MPFTISAGKAQVPPGKYLAVLETVDELPSDNPAYPGTFRKWSFLANVGEELIPISATSSVNNGPQTKSYRWLKALLRRDLVSGETIPDPIGQQVMVVIGVNKAGYSTVLELEPLEQPATISDGIPR